MTTWGYIGFEGLGVIALQIQAHNARIQAACWSQLKQSVFNRSACLAMQQYLLAGRAVAVAFHVSFMRKSTCSR